MESSPLSLRLLVKLLGLYLLYRVAIDLADAIGTTHFLFVAWVPGFDPIRQGLTSPAFISATLRTIVSAAFALALLRRTDWVVGKLQDTGPDQIPADTASIQEVLRLAFILIGLYLMAQGAPYFLTALPLITGAVASLLSPLPAPTPGSASAFKVAIASLTAFAGAGLIQLVIGILFIAKSRAAALRLSR